MLSQQKITEYYLKFLSCLAVVMGGGLPSSTGGENLLPLLDLMFQKIPQYNVAGRFSQRGMDLHSNPG
jgi:hypothetical protein